MYRLYTYSEDDDQDSARRLEASDDPPFRRRRASSGSADASRAKKYAAKLLEQTTFGPTAAEIARLSTGLQQAANGVSGTAREDAYAGVAREWVHEQNYHGDPCADGLHCYGGVQGPCAQLNEMTAEHAGYPGPYPLCADLPDKAWLRKGATYRYLGTRPAPLGFSEPIYTRRVPPLFTMNENWWIGDRPDTILTPDATHSQLFDALCALGSDGACTFPMEVVLPQHLACHDAPTILFTEYDVYNQPVVMNRSNECEVDEPRVIRLIDPSSGAVAFYEYERPACTELTFFNGGRQVQRGPQLGALSSHSSE